ncbi:hypothetical protein CQA09_28895, partial [Klebsiella pneumoniae]
PSASAKSCRRRTSASPPCSNRSTRRCRCAHVRLAADRPQGPPDRLDDVDDRHHRAQAHPRRAVGVVRALHHRARIARLGGVGARMYV